MSEKYRLKIREEIDGLNISMGSFGLLELVGKDADREIVDLKKEVAKNEFDYTRLEREFDELKKENERLRAFIKLMCVKINKVSATWRHGKNVSEKYMTDLCNYQVSLEFELEDLLKDKK